MKYEDTVKSLMEAAKDVGYGKIPPIQHSECFTIGAFDLIIVNGTDRARNFNLLTIICQKYDEVKNDEKYLSGYIYLLNQMVNVIDTTELPDGMDIILNDNPEKTKGLQEWFRYKN